MSLWCLSNYKLSLTCILLLEHTQLNIVSPLCENRDTFVWADRRGQVLLRLACWTPLSWRQRRCGSWSASPAKNKTSAEHYASTRAASLLLMDINIYMVWKIFSRRRGVGGLWWAETWADEVVCVRHLWLCAHVWMHKCISQHTLISHGYTIRIMMWCGSLMQQRDRDLIVF